jgi:hypothetical protein
VDPDLLRAVLTPGNTKMPEPEDEAAEFRDALAESTGELFELVRHLDEIVVSPEHAVADHPGDMHGAELVEPVLGLVLPFLMAALNGWIAAGKPEQVRLVKARFDATVRLASHVARLPTVVDPAVSFARGSCCVVLVSPVDDVTVVPGPGRRALARQYRIVLGSYTGLAWAQQMRQQPGVTLTPRQVLELDAWAGITGRQRKAPRVALARAERP